MFPEHKAPPPGIDGDIEMISAALEELRQLASGRMNAQDDAKIYDFSIRWGVLMAGRLKRLEHYNRAGDLSQDQVRRYRELRRELDEAAPQAERLGLARPNAAPTDQHHPRRG